MASFLIDVNLPYYFSLWNTPDYIHQNDIDDTFSDEQIWEFAKEKDLVIVTKDADFSNKILLRQPPPRVIHIRFGNMKMKQFRDTIANVWPEVINVCKDYKLVNVFTDRIEGFN